uniref:NADH-ubiquinone oxidoreductase chain 2 n=1 Tax=Sogata hakonensis TaxID=871477 RepID=A0A7S4YZ18_9HEMI|nr:NADH dehydrogenase subunit 2 [Sogata hakonensis]
MKLNMSKIMFITIIVLSSLTSFSVNNWLTMWILMELNLFMFMPLMTKKKINDQTLKYFIIQSLSSYILVFSMLWTSMKINSINNLLTMISMLIKIGMAPFHAWKPELMNKINWNECFLLTTLIKITPLILINKMISFKLLILPLITTMIMSSFSGFNQLSLKKMMAFSSIFNLVWMTCAFSMNKILMISFMTIYSTLNWKMMKLFKKNNLIYKNQLILTPLKTKISMNLNLLSISGLPPLMGFFPKWIVINEITKNSMLMSFMMIMTSILMMFMYIQMNTFSFTNFFMTKKMNKLNENKTFMMINLINFPMMMLIWMN